MRLLTVVLTLLALPLAPARAETLDVAQALYARGSFEKAADIARTLHSAEGHALAARATLVEAMYLAPEEQKLPLLDIAAQDARNALQVAPEHLRANVELAIALGEAARLQNSVTVHLNGYVGESRRHLDQALRLAPDSPWAHGLLGAWHLQVVQRAGKDLGRELYGATEAAGVEHCTEADVPVPESIVPRFGCALSLLELDARAHGARARQALARITELPARDAAERLVQAHARRLLANGGGEATY